MNLKLELNTEQKFWSVKNRKQLVAYIFLDYFNQVKSVVLFACSVDEELLTLQLACTHATTYLRRRHYVTYIGIPLVSKISENRDLNEKDSNEMMDFSKIDQRIARGDVDNMKDILKALHIPLVNGVVKDFAEALQLSMAKVILPAHSEDLGISCKPIKYEEMSDTIRLEFKTKKMFEFWNSISEPGSGFDLSLVPFYHPINFKKVPLPINGSTDSFIRGVAVEMIYSPEESRTIEDMSFSTWGHVNHPYKVTGSSFMLSVNRVTILSCEGVDELAEVLNAALSLNNSYVSVIGGFEAPYTCPHNRFNELGIPSDKRLHIRGSEARCVWEYQTLKQEGVLEKSYIPDWFLKEDWLSLYETAEFSHGI